MKAITRYDPRLGWKFSTYATWWIRQAVSRHLGFERNIRIPDGVIARLRKMARAEAELAQHLGREKLTIQEVADHMELPPQKILELRVIRFDTLSLDEQLTDRDGEETNTTRADLTTDGLPPPRSRVSPT